MVATAGAAQIRQYAPHLVASVTVPGDEIAARSAGFRRIARYIFGANTANSSIAMTAPVAQSPANIAMTAPVAQSQNAAGGWVISFYMPANYSMASLPKPNDPGIDIHELPGSTLAVYRFSGIPTVPAVTRARAILFGQLRASNWQEAGTPVTWFYDPPWTIPWLRRNEVAVPVTLLTP